jgi:hypothetical protein
MSTHPLLKPSCRPADFRLVVDVSAADPYEWSTVLLARAHLNGILELLSAGWERVLGYGRDEINGKTLCQLMGDKARAALAVAAILDERNMQPVSLRLCCRDGLGKHFRLHRRYDKRKRVMCIVAEEPRAAVRQRLA